MPFDLLRWLVQYLHVFAGILWFGAGFYTVVVQLPALLAVPAPQRGAAMAELAPRQLHYVLRLAELTILTGILNAILSRRFENLSATLGSLWGWAILVGAALAIFLYVLVQVSLKPTVFRMLALGRAAAQGDSAATSEAPLLVARVRRIGYVQMGVGAIIVLLMVTARFT